MAAEGSGGGGGGGRGRGRAPVLAGARDLNYYAKLQLNESKIEKSERSLEDLKYLDDHLRGELAELELEKKSILVTVDPSKHAEFIALAKKDLVIEESTVPPPPDDIRFDPKAIDAISSLAIVDTKMVPLQKNIFHVGDLITFMTGRLKTLKEEGEFLITGLPDAKQQSIEQALLRENAYLGTR